MCSESFAIRVSGLNKSFDIFQRPADRLKQPVVNRFRSLFGLSPVCYAHSYHALKEISFTVRRGETVGIIGRNGSGKSTLLQVICGILAPLSGQVEVKGRVAALLELGSGFNPDFTGRENVYMNAAILGLDKTQIDRRFDGIAAFADIGEFMDQPVGTYSSGMYVRLAFSVAAHVDADILVIDEALAVGDVFFTQKCMRFLRQFQKTGTLLFVSHDSGAVINLCERAIWLDQGRLREIGPARQVCENYLASQYTDSDETSFDVGLASTELPDAHDEKTEGDFPASLPRSRDLSFARDMRMDFLNRTTLRNDIEVFAFSEPERQFGTSKVAILDVCLTDIQGTRLNWVIGGEEVVLTVEVRVNVPIKQMVVGFFFKDRLGQTLFGDNTYFSCYDHPVSACPGEVLEARFPFRMPILRKGVYTVDAAVADGTYENHVQLQWAYDAFVLESHSDSLSTGLVGIPFGAIDLKTKEV